MIEKIKRIIINNYKIIIFLICIILFLALAEDVFNHEIMKGDVLGYKLIKTYLISNSVTPIMKCITWCGGVVCLISITVLLFIFLKNKKLSLLVFINLITITILNQVFKFILQRPRPTEFRIINESGYSFPSGHSMISMAFYGFLIYLIYKYIKNKYIKWSLIILLALIISFIGLSRIYLGVHYTSDVLAGFLISISYLLLYIKIINRLVLEKGDINEK